jgi:hypothetical protein
MDMTLEIIDVELPDLSAAGFRVDTLSDAKFASYRKDLLGELGVVKRAVQLLDGAPRARSCRVGSYGLKHTLERWLTLREGRHVYVSNGAAILACRLLGFPLKVLKLGSARNRNSPNANIGIHLGWYEGCQKVVDDLYDRSSIVTLKKNA